MTKLRWSVQTGEDPGPFPHGCTKEEEKLFWKQFTRYTHSFLYEQECPACRRLLHCYTQEDNNPEYYSDVHIPCFGCGTKVLFKLPVN